ncbi:MAG TPA: hypothetical protein VK689_14125, partial [Armatimonadota bacterium]|nr:hypothetical protein [Armatimonadota bacterium]
DTVTIDFDSIPANAVTGTSTLSADQDPSPSVDRRTFTFTPAPGDRDAEVGFAFFARSLGDVTVTRVFVGVVAPEPAVGSPVFNRPPTPVDNRVFLLPSNETLTFEVQATDPDGDTVTIDFDSIPGNAVTGARTLSADQDPSPSVDRRTFTFTPVAGDRDAEVGFAFFARSLGDVTVTRVFVGVTAPTPGMNAPVFNRPPTPADNTIIRTTVGQTVFFEVQATDPDGDAVTIDFQAIPANAVNGPRALSADLDPAVNVDRRTFSFTPVAGDEGDEVGFAFFARSNGDVTVTRVFVGVDQPRPTTIVVTRTPANGQAQFGQQICQTALVTDQAGRPLAGVPVTFTISGNTGNNGTTQDPTTPGGAPVSGPVLTDQNGIAQFCFTPLFPGTNTVTISVPGVANQTNTVTTLAAGTPGAHVSGNGVVNTAPANATGPIPGFFSLSVRGRANGRARGTVSFVVPATGSQGIFRLNSSQITSVTVQDNPGNRSAVILGTGRSNTFGRVQFRIDAVDGGFPGVPNDSFRITLLVGGGAAQVVGPVGGNLSFTRTPDLTRSHDIRIQVGAAAQ